MELGWRTVLKTFVAVTCFATILVGARRWYLEEQGNFHPVTVGEAYRSAQLDRDELEHYIRKFKIHAIINLRGKNVGEPWYEEEIATCRKLDVRHFDLDWSADQAPKPGQMAELLNIFRTTPRPVLVHCKAGADRAGLASAIWKVVINNEPVGTAERQLSIIYGHMPLGPTQVLDVFFKQWAHQKNPALKRKATGTSARMSGEIPIGCQYISLPGRSGIHYYFN